MGVLDLDRGAPFQQRLGSGELAHEHGGMQRRLALVVTRGDVAARGREQVDEIGVALGRGQVEGVLPLLERARIEDRAEVDEQLDRFLGPVHHRPVQRARAPRLSTASRLAPALTSWRIAPRWLCEAAQCRGEAPRRSQAWGSLPRLSSSSTTGAWPRAAATWSRVQPSTSFSFTHSGCMCRRRAISLMSPFSAACTHSSSSCPGSTTWGAFLRMRLRKAVKKPKGRVTTRVYLRQRDGSKRQASLRLAAPSLICLAALS